MAKHKKTEPTRTPAELALIAKAMTRRQSRRADSIQKIASLDASKADPCMVKIRVIFCKSGLSFTELGQRMRFRPTARASGALNFLRCNDPHISTVRRFATAMKVSLLKLFRET